MHKARLAAPCPFRAFLMVAVSIVKGKSKIIHFFLPPPGGDLGRYFEHLAGQTV
jgi:hypothetical protein